MKIIIEAEGVRITITEECIDDKAVLLHLKTMMTKGNVSRETEERIKSFCIQFLNNIDY